MGKGFDFAGAWAELRIVRMEGPSVCTGLGDRDMSLRTFQGAVQDRQLLFKCN